MGKQAVTVSYRLGGADGVSVEQRKWGAALEALGFATRRVAGVIEDDCCIDDLHIRRCDVKKDGSVFVRVMRIWEKK